MTLIQRLMPYVLAALLPFALTAPAQAADEGAKVVYHVDFKDPTRYSATLTSINNIINYYESELMMPEIHLVFVGYGIRFTTDDNLKGTPYAAKKALLDRREELKGRLSALVNVRDVKVHLCDKTHNKINLSTDKLYDFIGTTPSGVAKIAMLQSEGFAYLKVQ